MDVNEESITKMQKGKKMKDNTEGFRSVTKRETDGGRVPCRNGDLCRYYMSKYARIYSSECPYNCIYYLPVKEKEKLNEKMSASRRRHHQDR